MSRFIRFFCPLFFSVLSFGVFAQTTEVNYNILFDEPETINKLFIGFQPFYGEIWSTNPTIGFGLDGTYYHSNKVHFRMNLRRAYGSSFDMTRQSANVNSNMENDYRTMTHFEFGGTYHFKDVVGDSETTMVLYSPETTRSQWKSGIPEVTVIPSKVRTIIGGRLGGILYNSTADINRFIERQGIDYTDIVSSEGSAIPQEYLNEIFETQQVNMFTNMSVFGVYLGGSFTWIKNVSVDLTGYNPNVEDLIFTTYFDLLLGLDIKKDNLFYEGVEYLLDPIETNPIGARLGIEAKRNRKISLSYGAEIGYKPGLKNGGFFGMIKVAFPMYSTNLESNQVEAYESN